MKLLVVIASYGTGSDRYLHRLISEYRSMPYAVDIVVCSNVEKPVPEGVELVVGMPSRDPWSLPFAHKKIMAERADLYDLFIYSEDDTLATHENIEAFLRISKDLPAGEIAGFLRYENCPDGSIRYCDVNGHGHWDPASVVQRGEYTLAYFSNEHAAFYILTKAQLAQAIRSGGFLVEPHHEKYDLACSAATDPYTQCGFRKLVCISHLREFLLHHLPNKYVNTRFGTSEALFEAQVQTLLALDSDQLKQPLLVSVETKLQDAWYSKDYYEPVMPAAVNEIPVSTKSVLSIGCSSGKTERFLAERGARVTAICLDPIIASCARGPGIEVLSGDTELIRRQLAPRTFDCLFVSNVLHLAHSPEDMLSSFMEFLAPGGICVIVSPNLRTLKNLAGRIRRDEKFTAIGSYDASGTHDIRPSQLRKWLSAGKVEAAKVTYIVPENKQKFARKAHGILDPFLANEIILVGRRASTAASVRCEELLQEPEPTLLG